MSFSHKDRAENLNEFEKQEFDICIIGGGISGAGVARDAASRGMSVALVEANDFAFGTSSRSSKLIHGGIRYLENLEFGLVFEALSERRNLFEMAPHLVHPLRFVLPLYKGARVGMFKLGMGMWLYDLLAAFEMPELHTRLSKNVITNEIPILNSNNLLGAYEYSDAYMDDDRLVIETLRSAARFGAVCANYVKAIDVDNPQKISKLICEDQITKKKIEIKAKHFISTVGPWTDSVATDLLKTWKKLLRPSKGVHLTFEQKRVPLKKALVMMSDDEKRIVFAIPRHEMVIIGTTDTDFKDDPATVHTSKEDVNYLLHVTNEYFPGARIQEKDIVASYAGVRPLVHDGSASESKTSREHLILTDERNVTFLTGGKYTTYRKMAQQTVDEALGRFFSFEDRIKFARSNTLEPLNPGATVGTMMKARSEIPRIISETQWNEDSVNILVERHGLEALTLIEKAEKKYGQNQLQHWQMEAIHAIENTMCLNLKDFYLRRSPLFLSRPDHGFSMSRDLAKLFAADLGWSGAEQSQQINALQQHLEFEMSWRQSSGTA